MIGFFFSFSFFFCCFWNCLLGFGNEQCLMVYQECRSVWGKQFDQSMVCVYGKKFGLYRVCVSFTLCWLSLQGGLPGFKGLVQVRLFTLRFSFGAHQFRFYLGFKLGIFFIKFSLLPGLLSYLIKILFSKKECYLFLPAPCCCCCCCCSQQPVFSFDTPVTFQSQNCIVFGPFQGTNKMIK